jgi:ABC-2 type transport system permease protein
MLPIIFILPFVQLLILSNAASFGKNIKFSYIDHDHSTASRELISKFQSSDYFKIIDHFQERSQSTDGKGNVDVILEFLIILSAVF